MSVILSDEMKIKDKFWLNLRTNKFTLKLKETCYYTHLTYLDVKLREESILLLHSLCKFMAQSVKPLKYRARFKTDNNLILLTVSVRSFILFDTQVNSPRRRAQKNVFLPSKIK